MPAGPRRRRLGAPLRAAGSCARHGASLIAPVPGHDRRPRVVVATHSAHKLRELRHLLSRANVDLVSLDDLGVSAEPVEDGLTFETNAKIKARFAARATGLPTLADDSGLEVDALDGRPGVRTRRYAGPDATDAENNAKLLRELADVPPSARGGRYVCVLALAVPEPAAPGGLRIVTRRGTSRGRIGFELRGDGGFGYDPLFEPGPERRGSRTFAEYAAAEKDAISHRGRAARRMVPLLRKLGGVTPDGSISLPAPARRRA